MFTSVICSHFPDIWSKRHINRRGGGALWDKLKRLNRSVKCATSTLYDHSTNGDIAEIPCFVFVPEGLRGEIEGKVTYFVMAVADVCKMTSKLNDRWYDRFVLGSLCMYAPHRFAVGLLLTILIDAMLV